MENQYQNIANIQLQISENCSELEKEIIQHYWSLQETEFLNTPKLVKLKYNISQPELSKLNENYANVSLYLFCKNCTSYEKHNVTSQSRFKNAISLQRSRYSGGFKCSHCEEQQRINALAERKQKQEDLLLKLNSAIDNKNWKNLSNFEKKVLQNSLKMDFDSLKKHYGNLLGQQNYIRFIIALENIEAQHLIVLYRNSWNNYIVNLKYLDHLKNYIEEIGFIKEQPINAVNSGDTLNTLKFKLTINELQNHPDSPLYAGTVKFKELIVIEPNVDYVFGLWQRANDNLYLTLTPESEIDKLPRQKRLSRLPISLQEGITDFLNNMGNNIDF